MLTVVDTIAFMFGYEGYKISDDQKDSVDSNITYYGLTNNKGQWYILRVKVITDGNEYRYTKGDDNYATAWSLRESASYDYFYNIFK